MNKQKHIVFLADSISTQSAGIHYYGLQLIHRIVKKYSQHRYSLIATEKIQSLDMNQIIIPVNPSIPLHLRIRQVMSVPKEARNLHPDIVIELAHFGPFFQNTRTKRITVIHDLSPITHPKYHGWQSVITQKLTIPRVIKRADELITNSTFTKSEIERLYHVAPSKITVIHPDIVHPKGNTEWKDVSQKHRIQKPFILTVGTIEPRKNHLSILKAFEKFSLDNQSTSLVFVGAKGWKNQAFFTHLQNSNVKERVIITGKVNREELWSFYQNANVFIFASDFEGYGIPVKEAMFHHLPILLSDAKSLTHFDHQNIIRFNRFDSIQLAQLMKETVAKNVTKVDYNAPAMNDLSIRLFEDH